MTMDPKANDDGTDSRWGKYPPETSEGPEKRESKSFVVDVGNQGNKKKPHIHSLQAAFLKFRRNRQNEIRQIRLMKHRQMKEARDPDKMAALRGKFLDQAKKYFGVPYARKYWKPEDPEYWSPIFLDCCGLVRQVLRDLADDFGFQVGMWNQAYMFDTLPVELTEKDMQPGDLVFISATYNNEKSRKQRHDMVHVEIWLGDGPKTVGARWQKGKVQIFPHYAFEARSYHSPTYHFRSIDTWLMGICQSYCPEHPWRRSAYDPSRLSIFSVQDDMKDGESAGDTDDELVEEGSEMPSPTKIAVALNKYDVKLAEDKSSIDVDIQSALEDEEFCKEGMVNVGTNTENLAETEEDPFGGSGGIDGFDEATNQGEKPLPNSQTQCTFIYADNNVLPCSTDCLCMRSSHSSSSNLSSGMCLAAATRIHSLTCLTSKSNIQSCPRAGTVGLDGQFFSDSEDQMPAGAGITDSSSQSIPMEAAFQCDKSVQTRDYDLEDTG